MGKGSIQAGSFFRHVMEYHGLAMPNKHQAKGSAGVTIINNAGPVGTRRIPKDDDHRLVQIALTIPLIFDALLAFSGIAILLPPMLRPFHYSKHASAVSQSNKFMARQDVQTCLGAQKDGKNIHGADEIAIEIAEKHKEIASGYRSRARNLLLSATVLAGAVAVQQAMARGKMAPHASFGDKEAKITMLASAVFGLLSYAWYGVMTTDMPQMFHLDIATRSNLHGSDKL
jgi:hypothetical protein